MEKFQMPLNVMDAHYRSFEKEVLPEKTSSLFDGAAWNPEWLGEEPQRLQQLMPKEG